MAVRLPAVLSLARIQAAAEMEAALDACHERIAVAQRSANAAKSAASLARVGLRDADLRAQVTCCLQRTTMYLGSHHKHLNWFVSY